MPAYVELIAIQMLCNHIQLISCNCFVEAMLQHVHIGEICALSLLTTIATSYLPGLVQMRCSGKRFVAHHHVTLLTPS